MVPSRSATARFPDRIDLADVEPHSSMRLRPIVCGMQRDEPEGSKDFIGEIRRIREGTSSGLYRHCSGAISNLRGASDVRGRLRAKLIVNGAHRRPRASPGSRSHDSRHSSHMTTNQLANQLRFGYPTTNGTVDRFRPFIGDCVKAAPI